MGSARTRTAWAFGTASPGVQQGVATAVVYGVMVLVASLSGAIILIVAWFRGTPLPVRNAPRLREGAVHA
jgi:glycosyltransferase 2 family protein